MPSMDTFKIDLKKVPAEGLSLALVAEDDFFRALEQDEILGGRIAVDMTIRESTDGVFLLSYNAVGAVTVACDRCLDDLELAVEADDEVKICFESALETYGDAEENDDRIIPDNTPVYDASWDLYETIILALPIQRTHAENECNKEVLKHMLGYEED